MNVHQGMVNWITDWLLLVKLDYLASRRRVEDKAVTVVRSVVLLCEARKITIDELSFS